MGPTIWTLICRYIFEDSWAQIFWSWVFAFIGLVLVVWGGMTLADLLA